MQLDPNNVGKFLEGMLIARPQRMVNYSVVTAEFGLPDFDGIWAAHPLCEIFEFIDQQDANAKRPFRTSIVISKKNNTPGPGFFEALQRLKGVQIPDKKDSRDMLWIAELNAAYSYPW